MSRERAFTLLEVLIALVLVFVGLLMTMTVTWQYRDVARRIDAHTEAMRALDVLHETARGAGLAVDSSGQVIGDLGLPEPITAENLYLWADLAPGHRQGLIEVRLRVTYTVDERRFERYLDTYLWIPP
ncbi:MAG: type II secretion system protein [Acidobacteriota bacterium]